jgi:glutamate/tyrosine decarboxylase-like PLP-dependent enzyme
MTDEARLISRTSSIATDYLASLATRPVGRPVDLGALRTAMGGGGPLPEHPTDPLTVVEDLAAAVDPGLVASAGGRYFGFVVGGGLPAALGADWLTSAWDQNGGLYALSPAAAVAEEVAGTWLIDLLGLPAGTSVGFVTGATMANFTALAAARHGVLAKTGWDVERQGLQGAPPVTVITHGGSHITVYASLQMLGLGREGERVRKVAADEQGRMRPDALREALAGLDGPVIVCMQAGNVNSGAFDPFGELIPIAHASGAWVHIDGAFGIWAAGVPSMRHLMAGSIEADSWSTDAHKWLNVPYDSGLVFVRDAAAHHAAMTLGAEYYVETQGGERDNYNWTPESSRRARGFSVLAALRSLGRSGVIDLIERNSAHARRMAERLSAGPGVRILNDVVLNQTLVRFEADGDDPDGTAGDRRTRAVIEAVQREGTCWLGGTTWAGRAAMRVSVSGWRTTADDIERSADAILACLAAVDSSAPSAVAPGTGAG